MKHLQAWKCLQVDRYSFRRDSIKRLISEGLSNCNSVSIEYCGTVAAAVGLSAYGTKLSNEYATRIKLQQLLSGAIVLL